MGTSGSSSGPGAATPLVPSWLDDDTTTDQQRAPVDQTPDSDDTQPADEAGAEPSDGSVPAATAPPELPKSNQSRFRTPRSNYTRFAKTGDREALGRAVRGYVTGGCGGAKRAAKKMGASKRVATNLADLFSVAIRTGAREALRSFSLSDWSSRPLVDVFVALAEFFCPSGGTVDAGIARDAFVETMVAADEMGTVGFDELSVSQMTGILIDFISNSVEARILNDIGNRAITVPAVTADVLAREAQLKGFVRGFVSDAVEAEIDLTQPLSNRDLEAVIEQTYEVAFELMVLMGETD